MTIAEVLPTGRDNAISSDELCAVLGINKRELRAAVERERLEGAAICSSTIKDNSGYYMAANADEMQECANSLFSRSNSMIKVSKRCNETAAKMKAAEAQQDTTPATNRPTAGK